MHSFFAVAWNDDDQEPTAVGTLDPQCVGLMLNRGRTIFTVNHADGCACGMPPAITGPVPSAAAAHEEAHRG